MMSAKDMGGGSTAHKQGLKARRRSERVLYALRETVRRITNVKADAPSILIYTPSFEPRILIAGVLLMICVSACACCYFLVRRNLRPRFLRAAKTSRTSGPVSGASASPFPPAVSATPP